jgi:hypothetical protein
VLLPGGPPETVLTGRGRHMTRALKGWTRCYRGLPKAWARCLVTEPSDVAGCDGDLMFLLAAGSYVARTLRGPHGRLKRRGAPLQPVGRPLEIVAADARRLAARFHNPPPGTSFAKLEGARRAYEHVLAEACAALGVEHLLGVLPPGDELDVERVRVEGLLWLAGLRIDETA